jgi:hypothetical protein
VRDEEYPAERHGAERAVAAVESYFATSLYGPLPEKPTEKQIKTIIDEEFQAVRDPESQATTMDRIAARVVAQYGPVTEKPSDEDRIERITKEIHYWTRTDSDEMAARHAASNIVEEGL